jgi:hypothetical protein
MPDKTITTYHINLAHEVLKIRKPMGRVHGETMQRKVSRRISSLSRDLVELGFIKSLLLWRLNTPYMGISRGLDGARTKVVIFTTFTEKGETMVLLFGKNCITTVPMSANTKQASGRCIPKLT